MLLKVCDIFNTICQSFLFVWVCNNIVSKNKKISTAKVSILVSLIFSNAFLFTTYSSINPPLANLIALFISLGFLILFYRNDVLDAFVGFFVAYFLITITSYFIVTFYQQFFSKMNLNLSVEISMFTFVYIPVFLLYVLFYMLRAYIFSVAMILKGFKHSFSIIQIMTIALIFVNTLYMEWISEHMHPMVKAVIYIIAFLIFMFSAIYFAKINDQSKELQMLNDALNSKITELRKIKHDYGSEIGSIYGLYQLGKMDKLGELLKSIVERNQAFTSAVDISIQANPLIAPILNVPVQAGINVINLDGGDYEDLAITDNELIKLVSNIIKNSMDALATVENPVIKYRSFSNSNGIIINKSNNGPEIPQNIRSKIFEAGFSTKNNNGDRGYGLSIVKDIVNKCNGKMTIKSNRETTQFIFEIPYRTSRSAELIEDV